MKFNIYGRELEYSIGMENYNSVMVHVNSEIREMKKNFSKDYYDHFSNMAEVINGIDDYAYNYLVNLASWALKLFADNGVYSYDMDRFYDEYIENSAQFYNEASEIILDKYLMIIGEQQRAAEYRRERKAARGRIQGGGFGIGGAIAGVALAGTANLASGIAHSAVNGVGNAASAATARTEKSKLYESRDTVKQYCYGLELSMEQVGKDVIDVLEENSDLQFSEPTEEDIREGDAIVNNIRQGYIKSEDIVTKALDVLEKNPYSNGAYQILLEEMQSDKDGALDEMATYFGVAVVRNYKEKMLENKLRSISFYNQETFGDETETFCSWLESFHIEREPYERAFRSVSELFLRNSKVMDGKCYETVELKEDKEEVLKNILEKIKATSGNDIDAIRGMISELESSGILSKDKYVNYLNQELELENQRFCCVKDVMYADRSTAEQARKDVILLDGLFEGAEFSSKEQMEKVKAEVRNIVTEDLRELYMEYSDVCMQILTEQDSMERPAVDMEYTTRREFAEAFYRAYELFQKASYVRAELKEYTEWFQEYKKKYQTVNGQFIDGLERADDVYFTLLENVRGYAKYLAEQSSEKKGFFSKIKTGFTGFLYKEYEQEYMALTGNGTKALPNDNIETDKLVIGEYRDACTNGYAGFKKEIDEKYQRMSVASEIDARSMDASDLFEKTKLVALADIYRTIFDICTDIPDDVRSELLKGAKKGKKGKKKN